MDRTSNILKQRLEAGQTAQAEHPSADALAAFIESALKGAERERLLAHLALCSACRQAVFLAAPEVERAKAAASSRGFTFQFPAAVRWASLAAALAVAVGVSVITYEHEQASNHSSTGAKPAAASEQDKAGEKPALAKNDSALQLQLRPEPRKEQGERKKSAPHYVKNEGLVPRNRETVAVNAEARAEAAREVAASHGAIVSGAIAGALIQRSPAAKAEFNQEQSVNGFVSRTLQAKGETRVLRDESAAMKAAAIPSEPVAAPAVEVANLRASQGSDQSVRDLNGNRITMATKSGPLSYTNTVSSEAGPVLQSEAGAPAKAFGVVAIGGPIMKRSASTFSGIVYWTISAAGRLQRRLRDGAVKIIEPAPGLAVRAVAAAGIEVWAGGAQHDFSSKQWKQGPALFHSSDAGETWTKIEGPWHEPISGLNLSQPGTLTVVARDGSWTSGDSGKNWTKN